MKKLLVLTSLLIALQAHASDNWIASNKPVRDSYGECIANGFWTPATAHPECVKDLTPTPKPVAPPKPVAQAPILPPALATNPPATVPQVIKVTLQTDALFDFDKSIIKPEGRARLNEFVQQLQTVKYDLIMVVGHTDSIGSEAYNMRLGQRRAEAVKAYLISKGINTKIHASSRGEREPIADNRTIDGRAKNRRVVVEVIGIRNK